MTLVDARIDPVMEISPDDAAAGVTVDVAMLEDGVTTVTLGHSTSPTPLVHSGSATRDVGSNLKYERTLRARLLIAALAKL